MVDLILNRLRARGLDPSRQEGRSAAGRLAGVVGIVCNLLLFSVKLLAGLLSGSVAITADAANNLSDASSSVISLLGFKLSSRPADREHPYGHGRYEYIAGLTVAVIILLVGFELLKTSVQRIISGESASYSLLSLAILAFSVLLKLWMMAFNKKLGRVIGSGTLIATSADSRNDAIATSAVLLAAAVSKLTSLSLDGYMGTLVAAFIIFSGIGLIKETLDPVLGAAPDPETVERIRKKIMSYPGVIGTHDLMIHDYGPGQRFASVHVEMPAEVDVIVSHDVTDDIEKDFLEQDGIHMVVHYDPIRSDDETDRLRSWLAEAVKTVHPSLTIHDLRLVDGAQRQIAVFDVVKPYDCKLSDQELKQRIDQLLQSQYPTCRSLITVDRSYVSGV